MEKIANYKNGCVDVTIYDDGTKIREWDDEKYGIESELEFPESCDIKITNFCDAGCFMCFPPSQVKVMTDKGEKYIEDIKIGDLVYSKNKTTGNIELKKVTKLYKSKFKGNLVINKTNNNTTLPSTPNHKIYTTKGEVEAEKINRHTIFTLKNDIYLH